ncbi:MAG TPA: hypothetical protein VMU54_10115, partial [Planctomycetota bacterium]|nr:hypothetical protein [Planctomycetota bacterium]
RYRLSLAELAEIQKTIASVGQQEAATRRAIEVGEENRIALTGIRLSAVVAQEARLAALRKVQISLGLLEDVIERPLAGEGTLPDASPESPREAGKRDGNP